MAKVIFLGTNGCYATETGNTTSILIKSSEFDVVLDAGNGLYKLDRYIDGKKPVYLFLSHFHLDHIEGLYSLIKKAFDFIQGLYIITPKGGKEVLNRIVNFPFMDPFASLPMRIEIIEVPRQNKLPFKAIFLPLVHSPLTLGARLELDSKIISYLPETGTCKHAIALSKGADLVIAECSDKCEQPVNACSNLNPWLAATIAKEAKAKKLILTHFNPENYPDIKSRVDTESEARKVFSATFHSVDNMEVKV